MGTMEDRLPFGDIEHAAHAHLGIVFRSFSGKAGQGPFLDPPLMSAVHRTSKTACHAGMVLLMEPLDSQIFPFFQLVVLEIAVSQQARGIGDIPYKHGAVVAQCLGHLGAHHLFLPLLGIFQGIHGMLVFYIHGPPDGDGLEVFGAPDGPHSGSSSRILEPRSHIGIPDQVLCGRPHAHYLDLIVPQFFSNQFLGLETVLAPEVTGISKFHLSIFYIEVYGLFRLFRKQEVVISGITELRTKKAAHIGTPHTIGQGRLGSTMGPCCCRCDGPSQESRTHRNDISGTQWITTRFHMVVKQIHVQTATADEASAQFLRNGILLNISTLQVNVCNFSAKRHNTPCLLLG